MTNDLIKDTEKVTKGVTFPQYLYMSDFPAAFELISPGNAKDCAVIYDYGTSTQEVDTEITAMYQSLPERFYSMCSNANETITVPNFRKDDYKNVSAMGELIGKNIVALNTLDINKVEKSRIVGDGYMRKNFLQYKFFLKYHSH